MAMMPGFLDQWTDPRSLGDQQPSGFPTFGGFPLLPNQGMGTQPPAPPMPAPGTTAMMGMAPQPMPQMRPPMPPQPMPNMRPQMQGQGFHPFGGVFGNMLGMNGQGGAQGGHPLMDLLARLGLGGGGGGQPGMGQLPQGLLSGLGQHSQMTGGPQGPPQSPMGSLMPPWFGQQGPR